MGARFERSARLVKAFASADRQLAVASPWRQVPGSPDEDTLPSFRGAFLVQAVSRCLWDGPLDWRGDRRRAGGGALLQLAYPWLDWMTRLLGLPEWVSAGLGAAKGFDSAGPHDTEDAASVVLGFRGGCVGTITATWAGGPAEHRLLLLVGQEGWEFGLAGVRQIAPQVLTEEMVASEPAMICPADAWQADLAGFLGRLADDRPVASSGVEHLAPMAVLEAAYLSARSGQPEQPARFYQLHEILLPSATPAGGPGGSDDDKWA
jgi:predicted dehydrogenase